MPAKDLGVKHTCWKCGTKFYDLKKSAPSCPKCGTDPRSQPTKSAPVAERRRAKPEEPAAEAVDEGLEESEVDEDLAEGPEEPEEVEDEG